MLTISKDILTNLDRSSQLEWLETNGLGGWSSSTLSGAHTRGYHGILVPAVDPPVGRFHLVSRVDEVVRTGRKTYSLGTRLFGSVAYPQGYQLLHSYQQETHPQFRFLLDENQLDKQVLMPRGLNATILRYELHGSETAELGLELFISARDIHRRARKNDCVNPLPLVSPNSLSYQAYAGVPELKIFGKGLKFSPQSCWHFNFSFPAESERGLDDREDLFCLGTLNFTLTPQRPQFIVLHTESSEALEPEALFQAEVSRRRSLTASLPKTDHLPRLLVKAADSFVVKTEKRTSVIAGYHWFADWGRDTLISLPGLCLDTGRYADARDILAGIVPHIKEGLVPNRFADQGGEAEYNSADASLWFIYASYCYWKYTKDRDFLAHTLFPALQTIYVAISHGTLFGIGLNTDGLLHAGDASTQLTWMDARVDGTPVTPRYGKPVELNALWLHALFSLGEISLALDQEMKGKLFQRLATSTQHEFLGAFWSETAGYFYDCLLPEGADASLRPNQVIALGLPIPLVDSPRALSILQHIEMQLLTPRGLRTLSAADPRYRSIYSGGPSSRDSAYHQGTVWPWLLGFYIAAVRRYRPESGKQACESLLEGFLPHLQEEGVLGSISEIFDGDSPHRARGAAAQAWSVAELLRSWKIVSRWQTE